MDLESKTRRLKQEADIEAVLNYLGVKMDRKGANIFLLCPNPAHGDIHATNCYFKRGWNHVYCAACGRTYYAIDIIKWQNGLDFKDAAETLWEIEGSPAWYKEKPSKMKRRGFDFRLSQKEAAFIGIDLMNRVDVPVGMVEDSAQMPKGFEAERQEDGEYLLFSPVYMTWRDLFTEKEYLRLVINKAAEKHAALKEVGKMNLAILRVRPEAHEASVCVDAAKEGMKTCAQISERARECLQRI